ncbi:uncharacterized protein LOC120982242 [Bufo bufo]|uniref:uncharacterized protein LOC120982242 n=1 Tax=Bufo bufo TaxID=8384 RepID=UPI001ABE5886|nr:uncharacterized protein LOC120982242 [Bufo bufo]
MGLKTWMVLLWILLFVKGVSFADNCSGHKNIMVYPGEAIILDIDEDEVKENALIDGNGKDIARIENGNLTIIDERYKDNLTAKRFSFHIKSTAIEGKKNFTASVLYTNGSHCSQHYMVTVKGGEICSEIKKITFTLGDYFTLDFDAPGVENITWLFGSNRTIAVTKDKAKLQILDSNYEGSLSVINASLRKYCATKEDVGDYTARVIFHNGTRCQQYYSVTEQDYRWWIFFPFNLDVKTLALAIFIFALVGLGIKIYRLKRKKTQANKTTPRNDNIIIEKENSRNRLVEEYCRRNFMSQSQPV